MTGILGPLAAPYPMRYVSITDQTVGKATFGSAATAIYYVYNDGTIKNGDLSTLETWLLAGAVGDYEVRATVVSGSVDGTSSATATWLSCSSLRSWSVTNSAQDGSTVTTVLTIELRMASTGTVLDSATVELDATSNAPIGP